PELGELSGFGIDLYRPGMLLDDDVVTDREPKPRTFARWFGRKERIEHLVPDLRRNPNTIVTYPDLYAVAEAFGRSRDGGLKAIAALLSLALGCRVEAVRDEVEQDAGDLLWKSIDLAGRRVEGSLQGDIEALLLGPGAVIGEIKAFLDEGVDVDRPTVAGALPRMQQHVLDDGIGALAVLHDLVEVIA